MTSSKVVELRNENSVPTAAKYVQEQLKASLELGLATGLRREFLEKVHALIVSIAFGQDEKALNAHFDRLLDVITAFETSEGPSGKTPPAFVDRIEKELARRNRRRDELRRTQENLLDERDKKEERLVIVRTLIKHGVNESGNVMHEKTELDTVLQLLNASITMLTNAMTDNDTKASALITFRTALQVVGSGFPESIIGQDYVIN